MTEYQDFIKSWSDFYKKGFLLFVAVLATVFINIYTNNTHLNISDSFNGIVFLLFIFYAMLAVFLSTLFSGIVYLISVYGIGSIIFGINRLNKLIYEKTSFWLISILSLVELIIGAWFFYHFKLSLPSLVGALFVLAAIAPFALTFKNKIEGHNVVPFYIG